MMRDGPHEYVYLLVRILWHLELVQSATVGSGLSKSAGKMRWV